MSNIILRDYQNKLISDLRSEFAKGKKKLLAVSPVGSGKTVLFSYMAKAAASNELNVLILAHREELLFQISETLDMFDCKHGMIMPGASVNNERVQVGSVMTVLNRLEKITRPDLIIIDEAHHVSVGNSWQKILSHYNDVKVVGVTASPIRLDSKPLGDVFESMVIGPSVSELMRTGSLCDYKAFAPQLADASHIKKSMGDYIKKDISELMDKPTITGSAVDEWFKIAKDKRTVVFCASVKHAENVAEEYKSRGIPAASIDGKMDKEKRRKIIADFRSGDILVLTNYSIVSEGFNIPSLECVQVLRPTASLSLAIQIWGRGLRTQDGKKYAILIDHVGMLLRHGLPDSDYEWSLSSVAKKKKSIKTSEGSVKICSVCFAANESFNSICSNCLSAFEIKQRTGPEQVDGDLQEIDKLEFSKQKKKEQSAARTLEQLMDLGKTRGYKNPRYWAECVMKSRGGRRR